MSNDAEMLAALSASYRRNATFLERLRREEIRSSNTAQAIRSFDLAFKTMLRDPLVRKTYPLSKAQRALLGVDG
jgi:hypothetical protein